MLLPQFLDRSTKKKASQVAETIVSWIRSGDFGKGARLPPERQIAEQLQVSRGVVREALSALQIAGLIVVRTSEGSFVTGDVDQGGALDAVDLLEASSSPLELWSARRAIEAIIAVDAASRATRDDRAAISRELEQMAVAIAHANVDGYLEADLRFHLAYLAPANNRVLLRIAAELIASTRELLTHDSARRYVEGNYAESLGKHQRIAAAYRSGDEMSLRDAIDRHFVELEGYFLAGEA